MSIPNIPWDEYKGIINSFNDQANKDQVVWRRHTEYIDRHGEDSQDDSFEDITVEVLFQYNYFRSWPIAGESPSGTTDDQSTTMFINIKYLEDNGWLNAEGMMDFDTAMDRWIHMGITYICKGFTPVAQAGDEPLMMMVNLQREETENK